jgi:hypothetical protein
MSVCGAGAPELAVSFQRVITGPTGPASPCRACAASSAACKAGPGSQTTMCETPVVSGVCLPFSLVPCVRVHLRTVGGNGARPRQGGIQGRRGRDVIACSCAVCAGRTARRRGDQCGLCRVPGPGPRRLNLLRTLSVVVTAAALPPAKAIIATVVAFLLVSVRAVVVGVGVRLQLLHVDVGGEGRGGGCA